MKKANAPRKCEPVADDGIVDDEEVAEHLLLGELVRFCQSDAPVRPDTVDALRARVARWRAKPLNKDREVVPR